MPDLVVEKPVTLDLLDTNAPALSTTSDMPVIETQPDSIKKEEKPAPAEPKADKAEAAPAEAAPESEPEQTPETEEAASPQDEPKKPARGVQKRLDELVKQREDEKRRADALQEMLAKALAGKPEPQPAEVDQEPQRPQRAAYADDESWSNAMVEFADQRAQITARRTVEATMQAERQRALQQAQMQAQVAAQQAYQARVEKIVAEIPDYHEVADTPDVTVSIPMAHAIVQSEMGPQIQYHLGKHPEEAKRISALHPVQQLVELGKLEAKLSAPAASPQRPAVSNAPKPIKPHTPKGEESRKSPDEESMEEYAARRNRELAAERRPGARH